MADSATPPHINQPHVALITGAAQGIGRATALRLAEDGLDIAIADLKSQRTHLVGVAEDVRAKGRRCIVLECDISQEEEVHHMVQATEKEFNGLDIQRGGRIISASSVSGKKGMPLNSIYCASKSAIRSFTQALAGELGPHGITVNAYAPGPIDTLICSAEEYAKHVGLPDGKAFIHDYQTNAALPRIGTPEDIAGIVSFLAGKDSAYITGQTITIDGGVWMD